MQPIGVFDSGVGGLSVLKALRLELPHQRFVYVSDAGYAPYGERDEVHVRQRSLAIGDYLVASHRVCALVVACNTATAAAISDLRAAHPTLPIVGIEPAIKPAAAHSLTGVVGVLATRSTLASDKFQGLLQGQNAQARFVLQACDGLAAAIEHDDAAQIKALCERYTSSIGHFGATPGAIDTLVLGCTHYAFAAAELQTLVGPEVTLMDAGQAVAQRTRLLLAQNNVLSLASASVTPMKEWVDLWTTGAVNILQDAAHRWLTNSGSVCHLALA